MKTFFKSLMNYIEKFNKVRLKLIQECTNIPFESDTDTEWKNKFSSIINKYNGKVHYSFGTNKEYGRLYGNGYQSMPRDVRKYLADGMYIDLDVTNCHPVILEQLFEKYLINCPEFLKEYNRMRSETIKKYHLIDKLYMIKLINNAECYSQIDTIKEFHLTLYNELLPKLRGDYSYVHVQENKKNRDGSFISNVLQVIENDLLQCMIITCEQSGVIVGALCFDGLMVEKGDFDLYQLINKMQKKIKNDLYYTIDIVQKSMETDWVPNEIENNEIILNHSEMKLRKILNGLKSSRFNNRENWISIGHLLTHYTFGEALFEEFSKKSVKYDKENHKTQWNSFKNSNSSNDISIATVMKWLKEDNKELFEIVNNEQKIIQELNQSIIKNDYNITSNEVINMKKNSIDLVCDYEIAILPLHNMNSKCSKCELQGIYTTSGFLLKCANCSFSYPESPIIIPKTDTSVIYNILNQICVNNEDIKNKDTQQAAEIIYEIWDNSIILVDKNWYIFNENNGLFEINDSKMLITAIENTVKNLRKDSCKEPWLDWTAKIDYKKKLIEELSPRCYIKNIEFDSNPNLIGFPNGVLDLISFEFRRAKKDEFITITCKYVYDDTIDILLAENFLKDYFPLQEDYQYVLDLLSLCLEGRNRTQQFNICYGFSASNGKSFLMERLFNIFNDYSNTFPVNMITSKMREAGNANVDLINFKYKRFMYCSEPEANSKFNTNLLKQLTGDTITARKNYSNEIAKIKPTYNLFICCNRLPELDLYDEGINRRINIIEFKNKFVDKPNKKNKNEKQRKKYEEIELENIEKSLLHLLIKNFKDLKERAFEIKEPEYLKLLKESYGESNNNIKELLDEFVEYSENENDSVTKKEIKEILKDNKIKINDIDLIRTIEALYECEFCKDKQVNGKRFRLEFKNLKFVQ